MTKINGNAKVIVERIDNLKETIKKEFIQNREDHETIFTVLSKHGNSISALKALGGIGGAIVMVIIGILIKYFIG